MATVIRFARHGTKHKPYYRIVVQDGRFQRNGRFIERLGTFDPRKELDSLTISKPRLTYWLGVGAQLSDSVKNRIQSILTELDKSTVREPKVKKERPAPKAKKAKPAPKEA